MSSTAVSPGVEEPALGARTLELERYWWLRVIGGVLMLMMAFWLRGRFFIEKAYMLLVSAGIWALMQGAGDIVRAFALRSMRDAG